VTSGMGSQWAVASPADHLKGRFIFAQTPLA
jgi:hypothetical protein